MTTAPGPAGRSSQPYEQDLFDPARVDQLTHDLRTPLTVILGYTELIQAGNPRDDQRQGLAAMVLAGTNLSATIDSLLERVGADLATVGPSPVMSAIYTEPADVNDAAGNLSSLLGHRRTSESGPASLLAIVGEPEQSEAAKDAAGRDRLTTKLVGATRQVESSQAIDDAFRIGEPLLLAMAETQREADYLTGIGNRRAIEHRLEAEWRRGRRHGRPLAVLMVDIDGLKSINDTLGHAAGDSVIAEVARRLADAIRMEDEVARTGGDDYMIVCPETDAGSARAIVRKLTRAVALPWETAGKSVSLKVSIGWASTSAVHASAQALVAVADARLYAVKRRRKRAV